MGIEEEIKRQIAAREAQTAQNQEQERRKEADLLVKYNHDREHTLRFYRDIGFSRLIDSAASAMRKTLAESTKVTVHSPKETPFEVYADEYQYPVFHLRPERPKLHVFGVTSTIGFKEKSGNVLRSSLVGFIIAYQYEDFKLYIGNGYPIDTNRYRRYATNDPFYNNLDHGEWYDDEILNDRSNLENVVASALLNRYIQVFESSVARDIGYWGGYTFRQGG